MKNELKTDGITIGITSTTEEPIRRKLPFVFWYNAKDYKIFQMSFIWHKAKIELDKCSLIIRKQDFNIH